MSAQSCTKNVAEFLRWVTDELLKERAGVAREGGAQLRPVVGEPPLINVILHASKGNFIIAAHTGAGKTTLGLLLYHKAVRGELPGYHTIYVNVRALRDLLRGRGGPAELDESLILKAAFNEESDIGKEAREQKAVYSSITDSGSSLDIACRELTECLQGLYEKVYKNGTRLILFLDEMERTFDRSFRARIISNWFTKVRAFYDKTGSIPVKVVVALPKVLGELEELMKDHLMTYGGRHVVIFTELRELSVDVEVLSSYVDNLDRLLNGALSKLKEDKEFRRLLSVLGHMISGRFSIPILQDVISEAICEASGYAFDPSHLKESLDKLRGKSITMSSTTEQAIKDPIILSIIEGKPFRAPTNLGRKGVVDSWKKAVTELCAGKDDIDLRGTSPLKIGYQDYICGVSTGAVGGTQILWFSLSKTITENKLLSILTNAINKGLIQLRGRSPEEVYVLLLAPPYGALMIPDHREELSLPLPASRRKSETSARRVTLNFKSRILTTDELLAIASKGFSHIYLDTMIADQIYRELKGDLKSAATWSLSLRA